MYRKKESDQILVDTYVLRKNVELQNNIDTKMKILESGWHTNVHQKV